MSNIMEFSITIKNENGEEIVVKKGSREVPFVEEIEAKGFRDAFDDYETAVLELTKETRDAVTAEYLKEASKKKAEKHAGVGIRITETPYKIECELGNIMTKSHTAKNKNGTVFNSAKEFFDETGPLEPFRSKRFMKLVLFFSTVMSNRTASALLNRVRLETEGGISPMTLSNVVKREGLNMQRYIEEQCVKTLEKNGITIGDGGQLQREIEFSVEKGEYIAEEEIQTAAKRLEIESFNASDYEMPGKAVSISVDGIYVKRQTECRPRSKQKEEQLKRVNNTVVHIEKDENRFVLNSGTVIEAFEQLASFLLHNNLLEKQLSFFVDGARDINNMIYNMFGKLNIKIILDWYHLEKKCLEQLSMALKGSKIRNEFMDKLRPALWFGKVDKAINLLQTLEPEKVKNPNLLEKLAEYFERVRDHIPCYALRKELGLRNSSNPVEKANDIVVAKRQKRNGMGWSDDGSLASASVSAANYNGQLDNWVNNGVINFSLNCSTTAACL